MTKGTTNVLWACAIVLPLLAVLAHRLWPEMMQWTLFAGVGGGLLLLVWALLYASGKNTKIPALLSLIPVSFILLSQTVMSWMADGGFETAAHVLASAVVTLMLFLCVGTLMRLAYDGQFGEAAISTGGHPSGSEPENRSSHTKGRTRA